MKKLWYGVIAGSLVSTAGIFALVNGSVVAQGNCKVPILCFFERFRILAGRSKRTCPKVRLMFKKRFRPTGASWNQEAATLLKNHAL